jgi:hypothetical protein
MLSSKAKCVGFTPREDLATEADEQLLDLRFEVRLEEALAVHRQSAQTLAPPPIVRGVAGEVRHQELVVVLIRGPVLGRSVIVDAFGLATERQGGI